jgi:hypothetical protein
VLLPRRQALKCSPRRRAMQRFCSSRGRPGALSRAPPIAFLSVSSCTGGARPGAEKRLLQQQVLMGAERCNASAAARILMRASAVPQLDNGQDARQYN